VRATVSALVREGSVVRSGGDWDSWDLQVRGGMLGAARLRMAIEEHGAGRQLVRVRSWPCAPAPAVLVGLLVMLVTLLAMVSDADGVTVALAGAAACLFLRLIYECGVATVAIRRALINPCPENEDAAIKPGLSPAPLGTLVD
jgi:hypothetical protein